MLKKLSRKPLGIFIIFLVILLSACGEKAVISTPTESEAVQMVVILQENGITNADKRFIGTEQKKEYEVFVTEGMFGDGSYNEALRLLNSYCLPFEKPEEIQTKGIVDASETLKEKTRRQRKIEITQQLRKTIPGITCIELTFNSPQSPLERLNPTPSSAAVSLQYKDSPPQFTNEQIRDLVSKAIPGLTAENVTVTSTYVPIEAARLNTQNAQIKTFILIGSAVALIFFVMMIILFLRRGKTAEADDEDENYLEENDVPLLESAEYEDE